MNILCISSSPKGEESSTFTLAKEVLRGCESQGARAEVLHLCDLRIQFCHDCGQCHKESLICILKDDVGMILEKILKADGIVLASPNYINSITASMKAIFERASTFIHCQRLLDKYVVGVVTSSSGRDRQVLDYIQHCFNICAAQYSGGVSSLAQNISEEKRHAYELGKKLVLNIKEKKSFPEQIEIIKCFKQHFKQVVELRKDDWVAEYKYWQDKGWL